MNPEDGAIPRISQTDPRELSPGPVKRPSYRFLWALDVLLVFFAYYWFIVCWEGLIYAPHPVPALDRVEDYLIQCFYVPMLLRVLVGLALGERGCGWIFYAILPFVTVFIIFTVVSLAR